MLSWRLVFSLTFLFTCFSNALSDAWAQNARFDPVFVENPLTGAIGNGARFFTVNGCITITAAHVVEGTGTPIIKPLKTGTDKAIVDRVDSEKYDVAIIRQNHVNKSDCPHLPTNAEINQALLSGGEREMWVVDSSGNGSVIDVDLKRTSADEIEIKISEQELQRFQRGMSGSVVVFGGIPVGYVVEVKLDSLTAIVRRLDAIRNLYPDTFMDVLHNQKPKNSETKFKPVINKEPYSTNNLPGIIVKAINNARNTKDIVERTVKQAKRVKVLAEEAASVAEAIPREEMSGGLAHFKAGNGNYYRGEVKRTKNGLSADGYGVTIAGISSSVGNENYCRFVQNKGCNGQGVLIFATNDDNKNHYDTYAGEFEGGSRQGYGQLKVHCDGKSSVKAWHMFLGTEGNDDREGNQKFGVIEYCNNTRYEGGLTAHGLREGIGIMWNANGEAIQYALWENNKDIESYIIEWMSMGKIDMSKEGKEIRQTQRATNPKKLKTLSKYCEKNKMQACFLLGSYYLTKKETTKSINAFKLTCDAGVWYSCNRIGVFYEQGAGITTDYKQAFKYYEKSCNLNLGKGCWNAAQLIIKGYLPNSNGNTHKGFLIKACDLGHSEACK